MKETVRKLIRDFVRDYRRRGGVSTDWGKPLTGFADARDPYILRLKELVSPEHSLPSDVLGQAKIVVSYFIPFTREMAETNRIPGELASPDWARAYEETNVLLAELGRYLAAFLRKLGCRAEIPGEAAVFDRNRLISGWSQRHFARAAGLGTFGLNNMLITKAGCCGRYGSIVTDLDVSPDPAPDEDYCLYRKNGSCGLCVRNCPSRALTFSGYDRKKCYQTCLKNAAAYTEFGSSYASGDGSGQALGSEVCGKCVAGAPCAFLRNYE